MKLEQKNIVITGGTSGIGHEIVKKLHSRNRLMVIARDGTKLVRLAQEFDGLVFTDGPVAAGNASARRSGNR